MKVLSIIVTHWGQNDFRSETMRRCINSLVSTTNEVPAEIIVVDNGSNIEDSRYLLDLAQEKKIQYYIRNSENLYFGYARNQGVAMSCGNYIAFSDNDIVYQRGWAELGLDILQNFPDEKIAFTPLRADRIHRSERYWRGNIQWQGTTYLKNSRAGSNSWMMKRSDFDVVGRFINHRVAGSYWADNFVNKGYSMVTMENPLATDVGFKKGYNLKMRVAIAKVLTNGRTIGINEKG